MIWGCGIPIAEHSNTVDWYFLTVNASFGWIISGGAAKYINHFINLFTLLIQLNG